MNRKGFILCLLVLILAGGHANAEDVQNIELSGVGTGNVELGVLDSRTFVLAKEWAAGVSVYLVKIEDSKIRVIDSVRVPYMETAEPVKERPPGAVIRTVP